MLPVVLTLASLSNGTGRPSWYQVMVGGGKDTKVHSRLTELPVAMVTLAGSLTRLSGATTQSIIVLSLGVVRAKF